MRFMVTGGAGFIGSNLVNHLIHTKQYEVLTVDKLTYAGHMANLAAVINHPNHHFINADITDHKAMKSCINDFAPNIIFHLAAESHVDRSIDNAFTFINTNVLGTEILLSAALEYWKHTTSNEFKFIQISTDEVFGALGETGMFNESSAYDPNSPYSTSKAAAEMLCKAYYRTYKLPIIVANCSNNYGPFQFPEKLIPLCIMNALENKGIPIYGNGKQVRDWLYVSDHVQALDKLAQLGRIGETYCIGGNNEFTNLAVVQTICANLDHLAPRLNTKPYHELITYVDDRPGHDHRYAIDAGKISNELNWQPEVNFAQGIEKTVAWYLKNQEWVFTVANNQNVRRRRGLKRVRN